MEAIPGSANGKELYRLSQGTGPLLWGPQWRQEVLPAPPPQTHPTHQGGPPHPAPIGHLSGPTEAQPLAAGGWRAAELAVPVLVGPRGARHTLARLSAEVGARPAGHCKGRVERSLVAEVGVVALGRGGLSGSVLPDRVQPSSLGLKGPGGAQTHLRREGARRQPSVKALEGLEA